MLNSFQEVMKKWENTASFARDLNIPYQTAAAFKRRNSIPSKYWDLIVTKALERGYDNITYKSLSEISSINFTTKRASAQIT